MVIFPDSAFKYASSVVKHLPELEAPGTTKSAAPNPLLERMRENVRGNAELTIDVDDAHEQWQREKPFVLDVRPAAEYDEVHIPGAINIPLAELGENSEYLAVLPQDRNAQILSVCQRGNASLSGLLFLKSLGYRNVPEPHRGHARLAREGFSSPIRNSRPAARRAAGGSGE